jgi:5'-phosphate synthase pdxT subunit
MTQIGVLALQGDFAEHITILQGLGADTREVRLPRDLKGLDGLIIPGGESTTIGKLATDYGLVEPLRRFGEKKPIWGTCAGAILLSKDSQSDQPLLGLMDITVERNAFGRQAYSFEIPLEVPALALFDKKNAPFNAVFIRAPVIESVDAEDVEVLARLDNSAIVAARQGHLMATSFHPELSEDDRFHRLFLSLVDS